MKRILFICAFLGALSSANAQPIFGSGNVPVVGLDYTYRYVDPLNYDSLNIGFGANQTWSFKFNNGFDSSTTTIEDAATSAYAADFPSALFCSSTPGFFPSYNYYGADANGVIAFGGVTDYTSYVAKSINKAPRPYSLPFGLTYGTTLSDTIWYKIVVTGSSGYKKAAYTLDTLTYRAYGTLKVNGKQYNDVALVREAYVNYDSLGAQQSKGATLNWWVQGYPVPVVTMDTYVFFGVRRGAPNYINSVIAATRPTAERSALPYPNPALEAIQLPGLPANAQTVLIFSSKGARLELEVRNGQAQVNSLAPGLYWAQLPGKRVLFAKQ